jgi:Putative polyhydroxyalkanoic acid system protein (PHA_gran_rgn)
MTHPVTVTIAHHLGRAEARRRIETGFANVSRQLPGAGTCRQQWDGDRLTFSLVALGQPISGELDVLDAAVTMRIELPGMLGLIANGIQRRLQNATQRLLLPKD